MAKRRRLLLACLVVVSTVAGCSVNPVTGKNQLILHSPAWDQQVGAQQYQPARQMQGGDYVLDPELVTYVQSVGRKLAAVSDNPLDYEFHVLNNSTPNAWALPGGKISLNRGLLLEMGSEAELAAVLGHEIVHAAARHGAQGATRGTLLQVGVLATALATSGQDYGRYAIGGSQLAAALVHTKYGRTAELESDQYGMSYMSKAGYDPAEAVTLQETFLRLSKDRRQDWLSGLFSTHPPSAERVQANRETAASLPVGGRVAREEYRRKIATIVRAKPAYEAHDKARQALAKGDKRGARKFVDKALALEPREALFHGLRGNIDHAEGNYSRAVKNYTAAIDRNPDYFEFYLGRGESYRKLRQRDLAERDLERSVSLLPTADAMHGLGRLAEDRGDVNAAVKYYSSVVGTASNSSAAMATPAGKSSYSRLAVLDLPRNPGRYIAARPRMDGRGRVYVEIANRAPLPVANVTVVIGFRDGAGRNRQERRRYNRTIGAGRTVTIMLGSKYAPVADSIRVGVTAAQVIER